MANPSRWPEVEVLWWEGCPSTPEAIALVREEVAAAGLDPAIVHAREVRTDAEAAELGFPGSPTIRVDGADIEDPGSSPGGLTCRIYTRAGGLVSPLPEPARVREAIRRAAGAERRRR